MAPKKSPYQIEGLVDIEGMRQGYGDMMDNPWNARLKRSNSYSNSSSLRAEHTD